MTLRFGTARQKWSLNDGQIPNPNVVRVAPGTGYHRAEGNRRASRNGPVSDLPPEIPNVPIRSFVVAVWHGARLGWLQRQRGADPGAAGAAPAAAGGHGPRPRPAVAAARGGGRAHAPAQVCMCALPHQEILHQKFVQEHCDLEFWGHCDLAWDRGPQC